MGIELFLLPLSHDMDDSKMDDYAVQYGAREPSDLVTSLDVSDGSESVSILTSLLVVPQTYLQHITARDRSGLCIGAVF